MTIREATGFSFFGSGPNSRRNAGAAIAEIVDELDARGLRQEPLGVDRADAVVFLELAARGIRVVDATPVLETARAVKTRIELDIHRDNARLVDEAVHAFLQHLTPGKTENELWADLARETFSHGALACRGQVAQLGAQDQPVDAGGEPSRGRGRGSGGVRH